MKLVILTILSFLGYQWLNNKSYSYVLKLPIDEKIKFKPIFVIPYILLFPYLIFAAFYLPTLLRTEFFAAIIMANILATIIWYIFPNGVKRKKLKTRDLFSRIMNFIYKKDGDRNGFPSGHVFLSTIASYYLYLNYPSSIYVIMGILIAISAVFTKQHYVIDIVGGLVAATLAILMTQLLF